MRQDFDKTIRIPVITDVVRAGDPDVIERAKNQQVKQQRRIAFEQRLKDRIAELQAATGQDEYAGLARAHAIRSESNKSAPRPASQIDPAFEKHIDKARDELIRELSGLLKS
jgi:hypothetical protein